MRASTAVLAVAVVLIAIKVYGTRRRYQERLVENGWVMYARKGCEACESQTRFLGPYEPAIYAEEDVAKTAPTVDGPLLTYAEIEAYPTWYNVKTRELRKGYQNLVNLKSMADQTIGQSARHLWGKITAEVRK